MKRKDFLKLSSVSVFLAGLKSHGINPSDLNLNYDYSENNSQYMGDFIAPKLDVVKVAFIGVGARGSGHAKQIAAIEGTEVVAISDLYEDLAKKSYEICKEAVVRFALSMSKNRKEASLMLGMKKADFIKYVKEYNLLEEYNYDRRTKKSK